MPPNSDNSIPSLYRDCIKSFDRLLDLLSPSGEIVPILNDQIGRLRAWAQNAGAHRWPESRMSLEHRLREASKVRRVVVDLLVDLSETLVTARSIASGEEFRPPEQPITSGSPASEESSDSEPDVESPPIDPLDERVREISHIITCFYRFSIAIQNPAPTDRLQKCSSIDFSAYEAFDIRHISEKLPILGDSYLVDRLGRANTRRRQLLEYHRRHHQKIACYNDGNDDGEKSLADGSTHSDMQTTVSTLLPRDVEPSDLEDTELDTRSESELSRTSYASSVGGLEGLRVPDPPKEALTSSETPFECPYCFSMVAVSNIIDWKRHVYKDLRPYVCTFADCPRSDHLFDTRQEWFEHENVTHRREWFCNACKESYPQAAIFRHHIETKHQDEFIKSQLDVVVKRGERTAEPGQSCPLCEESNLSRRARAFEKHVGRHMRQIALFVLPGHENPETEPEPALESESKPISESEPESQSEPDSEIEPELEPELTRAGASTDLSLTESSDALKESQSFAKTTDPATDDQPVSDDPRRHRCLIPGCGRAFRIRTNLQTHLRTHQSTAQSEEFEPELARFAASMALSESSDALEESQSFTQTTNPATGDQSAFDKSFASVQYDWEEILDTSTPEASVMMPKHQQAPDSTAPLSCPFQSCGRTFHNINHLRKHIYSHQRKCQPCPICSRRLSREDALVRHLMQQHGQSKEAAKELARDNHVPIHTLEPNGAELGEFFMPPSHN
ncbi:hypothetical protein K440DRAFT_25588 [Wilcoxina mikolae CBS 423.85]|nr:hypothetical protein K440DRAFT_25588 [Wilcoxina mikolae CBS 423.85]